MIKYSKDWTRVTTHGIQYASFTLTEFLELIKENIPEGTSNDDVLIDFNVNACEDYNLYGDTFISQDADMVISIKKQDGS